MAISGVILALLKAFGWIDLERIREKLTKLPAGRSEQSIRVEANLPIWVMEKKEGSNPRPYTRWWRMKRKAKRISTISSLWPADSSTSGEAAIRVDLPLLALSISARGRLPAAATRR